MANDTDRTLVEFLKTQRWFGDKGRDIRGATVTDEIPIQWPNAAKTFAVARVAVETEAGRSVYQIFPAGALSDNETKEALDDPEFLRGLADAWLAGADFHHRGTRWVVQSEGVKPLVVPASGKIRLVSGEQTNSSVILNDQAILKLFRKLERGINPDVEVTRFLTLERQFVNVPALLGTIRFEDASGTTIAGMLQEFVPGASDAWSFVVEQLKMLFQGDDDKHWKAFDEEIEQLGAVTRAMHEELASGDTRTGFGMMRAQHSDLAVWIDAARRTIESATHALKRAVSAGRVKRDYEAHARDVIESLPNTLSHLQQIPDRVGDDIGGNTRTHGDYHLGQVLRSAAGQYLIIDFEGEPARPLSERRSRSSPLRDVAGMLRSFAYATAVAATQTHLPRDERDTVVHRSYDRVRTRFLAAYRSGKGITGLLPTRDKELTDLFSIEKQYYEVEYELDHRPDWVWVPLHDLPLWRSA